MFELINLVESDQYTVLVSFSHIFKESEDHSFSVIVVTQMKSKFDPSGEGSSVENDWMLSYFQNVTAGISLKNMSQASR